MNVEIPAEIYHQALWDTFSGLRGLAEVTFRHGGSSSVCEEIQDRLRTAMIGPKEPATLTDRWIV